MTEALALPLLAVVAGFVSFSSPCCLPLIPGYLSYPLGVRADNSRLDRVRDSD